MAHDSGAINLSQGFPDFPVDDTLIQLCSRFMREGHNQYAPMAGHPALLESISKMCEQEYKRALDPETEITITTGATEGLYAVITAFISPGDEVILFDPAYDSYDPAIRLNGGIPKHIALSPPDFSIDWQEVRKAISRKTKMIIINTPHNPTGAVLRETDLRALEEIVLEFGLLVLSDEVYERIIFDGLCHQSILRSPVLKDRAIAVFSFGKTLHATGWRVGYTIASPILTKEIRKIHQFITFSVNTPIQLALAEYIQKSEHYLSLGKFFQSKRDFFLQKIKGSSFEPLPSKGSYFQLVSYRNISNKPEIEMAEELTRKYKVAAIPVSVFYQAKTDNQLLRFCFAKKEDTLERACQVLQKL